MPTAASRPFFFVRGVQRKPYTPANAEGASFRNEKFNKMIFLPKKLTKAAISIFEVIYKHLELKIQREIGLLKLPKQLQNNFEKVQKTTFLTLKIVKMNFTESQNLRVNLDFGVIYQTFKLNI